MKFIDRPNCPFEDRKEKEPNLKAIDVIMLTLDAENFLEKCLYSVYREIPVNRLIVCDGDSKDSTIEIFNKFPRVELHVKPDIRTTGKALEFLMSQTKTEWFLLIDADIELIPSWYDDMIKNGRGDVLENSNIISAFHFYRDDPLKLKEDTRASDLCHLIRKPAIKNFRVDDDYMWRYTDLFLRQIVENSGFIYSKVSNARHIHNETERIAYKSDEEKNFRKLVWEEPKWVVIDKEKERKYNIKHAKAIVKYLDPEHPLVKKTKWLDGIISNIERKWVEENGPSWLKRYDRGSSKLFQIKKYLYQKIFSKKKKS